ncbi:hypothetical protein ACFL2R_01600 [Patescibacteria group bacterium]
MGRKNVMSSLKNRSIGDYGPIMLSGIAYFLFNFFTFTSYVYGGEIGRVDAINNSQVFLIILVEYFFLKHAKGVVRKLISAVLAIIGIYILGIVG